MMQLFFAIRFYSGANRFLEWEGKKWASLVDDNDLKKRNDLAGFSYLSVQVKTVVASRARAIFHDPARSFHSLRLLSSLANGANAAILLDLLNIY